MCGRYVINFDHDIYLAGVPLGSDIYNFNVAPTNTVPIIVDNFGGGVTPNRELHAARWGLLPNWVKDATFSAKAFNARSETIFEKPTFRQAATAGHCAIPVSGYFEWKTETTANGKQVKTPHFIHRADGEPIYFAGLYSWWKITEEEARRPNSPYADQAGQWLLSCSIITMDSPDDFDLADLAAEGHNEAPPHATVSPTQPLARTPQLHRRTHRLTHPMVDLRQSRRPHRNPSQRRPDHRRSESARRNTRTSLFPNR